MNRRIRRVSSTPRVTLHRRAAPIAVAGLGGFVTSVVLEHILVASLSPATHQVSEYANDPRSGWLMTAGFIAWAVSLGASGAYALGGKRPRLSAAIAGVLSLAAAAMLLTAAFHTQTVAGTIPAGQRLTASGRLHDLGSGIATLAILAAAILSAQAERASRAFRQFVWGAVLFAASSDIALLIVGRSVGGVRERILIAIGCLWQAAYIATLRKQSGASSPDQPSDRRGRTWPFS